MFKTETTRTQSQILKKPHRQLRHIQRGGGLGSIAQYVQWEERFCLI
jgi:hypothetical protein